MLICQVITRTRAGVQLFTNCGFSEIASTSPALSDGNVSRTKRFAAVPAKIFSQMRPNEMSVFCES